MSIKDDIAINGFAVCDGVYNTAEISAIVAEVNSADSGRSTFRKTNDLFAIRQFLKEVPAMKYLIFNDRLNKIIKEVFGDGYFIVKSIYFDKPQKSNWFVPWHQDLTISVDKKTKLQGYGPWTVKQNQYAVQPPLDILKNNFTIRIHLDDTDEGNGALKVIPASHIKGIYRPETINWTIEKEHICSTKAGGVMLMRPLLLHASNRTINNKSRRVIHIEFSKTELPKDINWSEKQAYL